MLFLSGHAWRTDSKWTNMIGTGRSSCIGWWWSKSRSRSGCCAQRSTRPSLHCCLPGAVAAIESSIAARWPAADDLRPDAWHDRWLYRLEQPRRRLLRYARPCVDNCNSFATSIYRCIDSMTFLPAGIAVTLGFRYCSCFDFVEATLGSAPSCLPILISCRISLWRFSLFWGMSLLLGLAGVGLGA